MLKRICLTFDSTSKYARALQRERDNLSRGHNFSTTQCVLQSSVPPRSPLHAASSQESVVLGVGITISAYRSSTPKPWSRDLCPCIDTGPQFFFRRHSTCVNIIATYQLHCYRNNVKSIYVIIIIHEYLIDDLHKWNTNDVLLHLCQQT
jgi:hypothetical protein